MWEHLHQSSLFCCRSGKNGLNECDYSYLVRKGSMTPQSGLPTVGRAREAALCRALCCGSAWGLHKACPAAHARRRRFCVQAPVARRPEQHADGHGERLQLFAGLRGQNFCRQRILRGVFRGIGGPTGKFFPSEPLPRSSFAKSTRFGRKLGDAVPASGISDPSQSR